MALASGLRDASDTIRVDPGAGELALDGLDALDGSLAPKKRGVTSGTTQLRWASDDFQMIFR